VNNRHGPQNDLEQINVSYSNDEQNGFIRKVYGIFTSQIACTMVFVGFSMMYPEFTKWQIQNIALFWVLFVLNIAAQCTLICNKEIARSVPINYILLAFITFSEGYLISLVCAKYTPASVFKVFILTTAAFGGMTFYAVTTKHDITIFYSVAAGVSMLTFAMFFVLLFTASPMLQMVYSFLMVILALLYVAIDTQVIMQSGKHGIGYDDYIVAALMLYLDFIQLFLNLL
jgi:FtsH-binding integral membrane protein